MTVTSLLVSDIMNITLGNGRHFVKWPPFPPTWLIRCTGRYENTCSEIYAQENQYRELIMKVFYVLRYGEILAIFKIPTWLPQ